VRDCIWFQRHIHLQTSQQRLLRLPPPLRPHHHLRNGLLHAHPEPRPLRPALHPLLLHNPHLLLAVRQVPNARAVLRSGSHLGGDRVHHQRDDNDDGTAVFQHFPVGGDFCFCGAVAGLGFEHSCDGVEARGRVYGAGYGWAVWAFAW
jgi:hypothetical protein